jgi:hypothetical protein
MGIKEDPTWTPATFKDTGVEETMIAGPPRTAV